MSPRGKKKEAVPSPIIDEQAVRNHIARKAYERFESRGGAHGYDFEDWVEAEREVLAELKGQLDSKVKVLRPKTKSRARRSTAHPS